MVVPSTPQVEEMMASPTITAATASLPSTSVREEGSRRQRAHSARVEVLDTLEGLLKSFSGDGRVDGAALGQLVERVQNLLQSMDAEEDDASSTITEVRAYAQ